MIVNLTRLFKWNEIILLYYLRTQKWKKRKLLHGMACNARQLMNLIQSLKKDIEKVLCPTGKKCIQQWATIWDAKLTHSLTWPPTHHAQPLIKEHSKDFYSFQQLSNLIFILLFLFFFHHVKTTNISFLSFLFMLLEIDFLLMFQIFNLLIKFFKWKFLVFSCYIWKIIYFYYSFPESKIETR